MNKMITKCTYVTEQGLASLQEELEQLQKVERLELIERLADAKTGGDWMDSAEHTLVEEELAFVEARIRQLQAMIGTAEIIPPDPDPIRVNLGDTVVVKASGGEIETYTIVGSAETDPKVGLISNESPLGKALLNHKVGDEVLVHAPAGDLQFRVVALGPPHPEEKQPAVDAEKGRRSAPA